MGQAKVSGTLLKTLIVCAIILAASLGGMKALATFKRPPKEAEATVTALPVEVLKVAAGDVQVVLVEQGQVRALNVVSVAPEVAGVIVEVHPNLEMGAVIPKGEALFVVDPRTYEASVDEAQAATAQLESSVAMLKISMANDRARLEKLTRSRDLAKAEFERKTRLFEQDQVGSLSLVEATEQAYNQAEDLVDQLQRQLAVYPVQIKEAESGLASMMARRKTARINLERTRVLAPFNARVKQQAVEVGQYVAPGVPVATLADDSVLEISVPLDSRDAQKWLRFNGNRAADGAAWFTDLEPVKCTVRWTEDPDGDHMWEGALARVEMFDAQSRRVYVAVRVEGANALSTDKERLPLVDGMFCSVEIPGRVLEGVYELPDWAVSYEKTVYRAEDGLLKTVPVEVALERGDSKYVSSGLEPGDLVVITRLVNPLDGSKLKVLSTSDTPDTGGAS
jgi:RND family efflux transporter MFP subunit